MMTRGRKRLRGCCGCRNWCESPHTGTVRIEPRLNVCHKASNKASKLQRIVLDPSFFNRCPLSNPRRTFFSLFLQRLPFVKLVIVARLLEDKLIGVKDTIKVHKTVLVWHVLRRNSKHFFLRGCRKTIPKIGIFVRTFWLLAAYK